MPGLGRLHRGANRWAWWRCLLQADDRQPRGQSQGLRVCQQTLLMVMVV